MRRPPCGPVSSSANHSARLSESVFAPVPLLVATAPDATKAAVGLAALKDAALGLTLDPATLEATPVFKAPSRGAPILDVVPLTRAGKVAFAVDRADPKFAYARTVDGEKPFTMGVNGAGFSRRVGGAIDVIWPGKSGRTRRSRRRASPPFNGVGHVVAFRHGGQDGKIPGRLVSSDDGSKLTELKMVGTECGARRHAVDRFRRGSRRARRVRGEERTREEDPSGASKTLQRRARRRAGTGTRPCLRCPRADRAEKAIIALVGGPPGRSLPSFNGPKGPRETAPCARCFSDPFRGSRRRSATPITVVHARAKCRARSTLWVHGKRALVLYYLVKLASSHEIWGASLECP